MKVSIRKLQVKRDERGMLYELLRAEHVGKSTFGQILITTAKPGMKKGGHYHNRKREWYCVIKGKGLLTLKNLNTKDSEIIELSADNPTIVEMPMGIFHQIENIGVEELILLVYISEEYNPNDSDTYTI